MTANPPAAPGTPLLRASGIRKVFPGVVALDGVDFELRGGEVHALLGENGAGKSTLMKVIAGIYGPDDGTVEIGGEPVELTGPLDAQSRGIGVIHQELNLMPDLTVAENIFFGREPRSRFRALLSEREAIARSREILARVGLAKLDPSILVGRLTVATQQMVEIAKALSLDARVLIMDEPTAALNDREVDTLMGVIADFVSQSTGVVYVSHRMEEIMRVSDRVTVLRDGKLIDTTPAADTTIGEIIRKMVGRQIDTSARPEPITENRPIVLEVTDLSTAALIKNVSFDLREGEVLGFAGLMGAGRTETARALVGADERRGGTIRLRGEEVTIHNPADAVRQGIGYLSEDRKHFGLILDNDVTANVALASLGRSTRWGFIRDRQLSGLARRYVKSLRIKTPSVHQIVRNLSGGNQQKVVLAKWLARDCDILIIDEPTRGIDVGAKEEIYTLIEKLKEQGTSIIVISSEIGELMRLSDRMVVMCNGRVTGVLSNQEATQERIMTLATQFTDLIVEAPA